MPNASAAGLLREVRIRHELSQEDLAIRAGLASEAIAEIENGRVVPELRCLGQLLELLGEDLVLSSVKRETGIDITLNQSNLELSSEERVQKGLVFADFVRRQRGGGSGGLGLSLEPGLLLEPLQAEGVNFVVIGGLAGLAYGSAYPTYDLDVAVAGDSENVERLVSALRRLDLPLDAELLAVKRAISFDSAFGILDVLSDIPGISAYEELRRDAGTKSIAGREVPVASLNHLIAIKRASGKRKDQLMVMEYVELADELRRREKADTEG